MWGEAEQFRHWIEILAHMGIESFAVSLRGHGNSAANNNFGKTTLTDYRHDAESLLTHIEARFGQKPTIIVGHSMGGRICQLVLSHYQHHFFSNLRGIILLASAPPPSIRLKGPVVWRMLCREYLLAMLLGQPFKILEADIKELLCNGAGPAMLFERQVPFNPESGRAALEIALGQYRSGEKTNSEQLKKVRLFSIAGEEDRMIEPSVHQKTAEYFGIQPFWIPREGHMMSLGNENRVTLSRIVSCARETV